jgi:hypothetical protein
MVAGIEIGMEDLYSQDEGTGSTDRIPGAGDGFGRTGCTRTMYEVIDEATRRVQGTARRVCTEVCAKEEG